jgi:AbiTii
MSLLRDIQNAAVDPHMDIATLLRKCKILAVRLGSEEFKRWIDHELNGYDEVKELPNYRVLETESLGTFAEPYGQRIDNLPVPPLSLPEQFRDRATKAYLMQSVSAYASLIEGGRDNPIEPWPADMTAMFARKIYPHLTCVSAWKVIPHNALVALIDTIKTRVLNFVLEIEEEAPAAGEAAPHQPPLPQEKVSQVFNTYISGNVQNVATGSSHSIQAEERIVMRDQYTAGQAGAMGPRAEASHMTFQQIWQQSQGNIDLAALAGELATLRKAMRQEAEEPFHDKAVAEIGEAQEAAQNHDGPKVLQHLKNGGKWALDVATKIGVNLATEALKKSLGS